MLLPSGFPLLRIEDCADPFRLSGTTGHCYLMIDDLKNAYSSYQQALYYMSNPNVRSESSPFKAH